MGLEASRDLSYALYADLAKKGKKNARLAFVERQKYSILNFHITTILTTIYHICNRCLGEPALGLSGHQLVSCKANQ